jgi:outer membrane immunogenic protein
MPSSPFGRLFSCVKINSKGYVMSGGCRVALVLVRSLILTLALCFQALLGGPASFAADIYSPPPTSAKDAPVPPPTPVASFDWRGPYVGAHVGGAWGDIAVTDTYTYIEDPTETNAIDAKGLIAGGQLGYNFRSGQLIYGFEADFGGLDLSGSKSAPLVKSAAPLTAKYSVSGGLYGDFAGRVGYVANRSFFYAKGGPAFLNADFTSNYTGTNTRFNYADSAALWGFTFGGGVEYALHTGWSLKLEYQHFDFGDTTFEHKLTNGLGCTGRHCATFAGAAAVSPTADAVTVGVNYHFNGTINTMK